MPNLFNIYLSLLTHLNRAFVAVTPKTQKGTGNKMGDARMLHTSHDLEAAHVDAFTYHDQLANEAATTYRSLGIIISLLGFSLLLCSVIAGAMSHEQSGNTLSYARLLVLLVMYAVIYLVQSKQYKERWLEARISAERIRYQWLNDTTRRDPQTFLKKMTALVSDQIEYNTKKQERYEQAENAVGVLTWFGFALALVSAIFGIFTDWHWLTVLTEILLAFIATLHIVNSFLELEPLCRDHALAVGELEQIQKDILKRQPALEVEQAETAFLIYAALNRRDLQWQQSVLAKKLRPAT